MAGEKALLRTIPLMQSLRLVKGMKGIPKKDSSGKGIRANRGRGGCYPTKKLGVRNLVKGTTRILVGIPLIKSTANAVESY